jgi:hypothetical protein
LDRRFDSAGSVFILGGHEQQQTISPWVSACPPRITHAPNAKDAIVPTVSAYGLYLSQAKIPR